MADGSQSIGSKKSPRPAVSMTTVRLADGSSCETPDTFPPGTQIRLCTIGMALGGAIVLLNDIMDGGDAGCGVMATLDLAVAELTRLNNEYEAYKLEAKPKH
jgi:hypothetical protein